MNIETFASASQDELIDWATELAYNVISRNADITDEASVTQNDLIFALAVYKMLEKKNLFVKDDSYKVFAPLAEAELRRRSAVSGTV